MIDLLLIGIGLSMDAFAASVCKGLKQKKVDWLHAFITALSFGAFQAIMPIIGWLAGSAFMHLIEPVDHWIAFVLLAGVGGKMIWDAFHGASCDATPESAFSIRELLVLSVATSLDALAVGVSFAASDINVWLAVSVIFATTFTLSLLGFLIGNKLGAKFERGATITGGVCLIILGAKILLEHLSA
ncbi:MAG: manganese efflux pump [Eggerthellaceae bacterium]|nr:manganese efflux pump [Eggerthellaceae bacterium]